MRNMAKSNLFLFVLGIGFIVVLLGDDTFAQSASLTGMEPGKTKLEALLLSTPQRLPVSETFFEGPVNPDVFELGPGDKLDIFLWRPTVTQLPVDVNAEGEAIIPAVGPVKVSGMSLAKAKDAIIAKIHERFSDAEATVSLREVRKFRVHVCGAVTEPGSYLLPATARVADAVWMAGGFSRSPRAEWDTTSVVVASQRRLQVISSGGIENEQRADLLLFERAGRTDANPLLHDGDVVRVPLKEEGTSEVGVFGGVFSPGLFEYVPGDRIEVLLELAGGLRASANVKDAYIINADGNRIDVEDAVLQEYEFQPGDRLYIPMEPERKRFGTVTLKGEVTKPGSYPLEIGKTTLNDILAQAGGPLPTAALNSARLVRAPDYDFRQPEKGRLLRPRDPGNAIEKRTAERDLTAALERWLGTTVVIDLQENNSEDILLRDGDVLEIPEQPLGIRVLGYVNQNGETAYHLGWKLNDYLRAVGGVNRGGWKSKTRVVKASTGAVVLYSSKVRLDPGDIIFVPPKPEVTTWGQIKDGIVVLSQVATIAFIVSTL